MAASRLVCGPCNVISEGPSCSKCNGELTVPTAFDCAQFGLVPELQELVKQVKEKYCMMKRFNGLTGYEKYLNV